MSLNRDSQGGFSFISRLARARRQPCGRPLQPTPDRLQERSGGGSRDSGQHRQSLNTNTDLQQQGLYDVPIRHDVWTHLNRSQGAVHDVCERERGHLPPCRPLARRTPGNPSACARSHGCVRMPMNHARWLFHNTPKGTPITIQA